MGHLARDRDAATRQVSPAARLDEAPQGTIPHDQQAVGRTPLAQLPERLEENLDTVPLLEATQKSDDELVRSVARLDRPPRRKEDGPVDAARDDPHAARPTASLGNVRRQRPRGHDNAVCSGEQELLQRLRRRRVEESAILFLLGDERRVHLEEERQAPTAREAQARVGPQGVALEDQVERPARVERVQVLGDALVEQEAVDLGGPGTWRAGGPLDPCRPPPEAVEEGFRVDVDHLAGEGLGAAPGRGPGRQHLHLRTALDQGVYQLADVSGGPVASADRDATVAREVGDPHQRAASNPTRLAARARAGAPRAA